MATDEPEKKTRGWDERQVKEFVFQAIKHHKAAWDVVPSLRRAIVAEAFAVIVTGQDRESIPTIYIENLWSDMQDQARKWGME